MKIKYKFTIAILVFLIFIAGISAATASILTVDSANKTTTVNNNATYILTVNNTGTNTDTFNSPLRTRRMLWRNSAHRASVLMRK